MLTIPASAARLTREVRTAEEKIGDALVATTALLHSAALARVAATDVDATLGHAELKRLTGSVEGLIGLRADMARVHGGLATIGVGTGILDEPTCPDAASASLEQNTHRIA